MDLLKKVKDIEQGEYYDEDGESIVVSLLTGLNLEQIEKVKEKVPNKSLPESFINLLKTTKAISFRYLHVDEISFTNFGEFRFKELIQSCLTLAGDGAGNYWIMDILSSGDWGDIYFICHDPPVIVKQASSIPEFLNQLHEFLLSPADSILEKINDTNLTNVHNDKTSLIQFKDAIGSKDLELQKFATQFNEEWIFGDLRNSKNGEGFRLEGDYGKTKRNGDQLLWAMKKQKSTVTRIKNFFRNK